MKNYENINVVVFILKILNIVNYKFSTNEYPASRTFPNVIKLLNYKKSTKLEIQNVTKTINIKNTGIFELKKICLNDKISINEYVLQVENFIK